MKLKVITPLGTFKSKNTLSDENRKEVRDFCKKMIEDGAYLTLETTEGEIVISGEMIKQSIFILED